jgi:hypothetical protein
LITDVKDSEIILIDVPAQYVKNGEPSAWS